jgi:hypothetical protein
LSASSNWRFIDIDIPDEMRRPDTRLVFYYDDNYRWGMGAGIDDITVTGIPMVPSVIPVTTEKGSVIKVIHEGGNEVVSINVKEDTVVRKVQVISMSGKVIWQEELPGKRNTETRVILPSLARGMYILRLVTSTQDASVKFEVF